MVAGDGRQRQEVAGGARRQQGVSQLWRRRIAAAMFGGEALGECAVRRRGSGRQGGAVDAYDTAGRVTWRQPTNEVGEGGRRARDEFMRYVHFFAELI